MMIAVNELFSTIQGEGEWTGMPSVFVRLQGCAVGCPWCDTKHTWHKNIADQVAPAAMAAKTSDAPTWSELLPSALVSRIATYHHRHVVITGGEPAIWDLRTLTDMLLRSKHTVQIETSGTAEVKVAGGTWITCSPKFGMPGGLKVRDDVLRQADEIKLPVGKHEDILRLQYELKTRKIERRPDEIWLQPLSLSPKATELCIDQCMRHGYRLSIQTHKLIGVR